MLRVLTKINFMEELNMAYNENGLTKLKALQYRSEERRVGKEC